MAKDEFQEQFQVLKSTREKCEKVHEEKICFYADCVIRMYNAYYKIHHTEMLSYVKQTLSHAFPLVITYFAGDVDLYLNETDANKKLSIAQDIEQSVVKFAEMFETTVDSTNGADRILVQTAPVYVGLRYTAPKLSAYYSIMLNDFVGLFQEKAQGEYAFCVCPSLSMGPTAYSLFHSNHAHGKVCVIQIPENQIGYFSFVRQVLFHEFFHIQPGFLRNRKDRADRLNRIYPMALISQLSSGCEKKVGELTLREKVSLQNFLVSDLQRRAAEKYSKYPENDERFYSRLLYQDYVDTISSHLLRIMENGYDKFMKSFDLHNIWTNYQIFTEQEKRIRTIHETILDNITTIISSGGIAPLCDFYMILFREPLSDIGAVLTLRLKPEEFFMNLIGVRGEMSDDESTSGSEIHLLYLRAAFVADVLRNGDEFRFSEDHLTSEQAKLLNSWKDIESYRNCCRKPVLLKFLKNMYSLASEEERSFLAEIPELIGGKTQQAGEGAAKTSGELQQSVGGAEQTSVEQKLKDGREKGTNHPRDADAVTEKGGVSKMSLTPKMRSEYTRYFQNFCCEFLTFEKRHQEKFDRFRRKYRLNTLDEGELATHIATRMWEIKEE